MSGDDSRTRYIVITLSTILLVALVAVVAVSLKQNGDPKIEEEAPKTSQRNVQLLCHTTEYQETCKKSLSQASKETSDIKELIKAGFNATAMELQKHIENYSHYKELAEDNMTRQAMDTCYYLMQTSVDDIYRSIDRLSAFELNEVDEFAYEIKVWLSALLTHQHTCLDGFGNTDTKASRTMTNALKTSIELSKNALSMMVGVSNIEKYFGNLISRKLLSEDGYPSWLSNGQRQLLQAGLTEPKPNVVVARDGSGDYTTLTNALNAVPKNNNKPFVIHVKSGVYKERVTVEARHVTLIGDGPTKTRFTGSRNYLDNGNNTFETGTFNIKASNFTAKNIGFENTAGPVKNQAVALLVNGDAAVFYNCHMDGYQDTLLSHAYRQFFRDCRISGTVDFIFGAGEALFQNCTFVLRKPRDGQECVVLAAGRQFLNETGALVLQRCHLTADPEFMAVKGTVKAYLGRPWKEYAKSVIMDSHIDSIFELEGYLEWKNQPFHQTCSFYEYNNRGALADALDKRVKWPDVKQLSPGAAKDYYPGRFFQLTRLPYYRDQWILDSAVPYSAGAIV